MDFNFQPSLTGIMSQVNWCMLLNALLVMAQEYFCGYNLF